MPGLSFMVSELLSENQQLGKGGGLSWYPNLFLYFHDFEKFKDETNCHELFLFLLSLYSFKNNWWQNLKRT